MERSKFSEIQKLSGNDFFRLTGVRRSTFDLMLTVLLPASLAKKKRGSRPPKLCVEDQLLMALEYLREYRTYFHLGGSYGLSESAAWSTCRWIEDTLIGSGAFSLPGKKALREGRRKYDLILIDVTESPICRPKKSPKGEKNKEPQQSSETILLGKKEAPYH